MSYSTKLSQNSTAVVVWTPPVPSEEFVRSEVENSTGAAYRRSLELAKFERDHLIATPSHLDPHLDPHTVRRARSRRLGHVLPPLTGPYAVGHLSMQIDGPQKTRSVGNSEIGIELYAPTGARDGSCLRLPERGLETLWSLEQLATLHTHSRNGIIPITKAPIVIFSHGFGTMPVEYRLLLEESASHGYVVCALNHPATSGYAPFSQETLEARTPFLRKLQRGDPEGFEHEIELLALAQAENIRFVVEQIQNGNGEFGIKLNQLGIPDQIILAGHSFGGTTSIIASRSLPKIAGCINLDGELRGPNKTEGLKTPLLTILSDHSTDQEQEIVKRVLQDFMALRQNSALSWMGKIEGIGHMDFCITPILKWLIGDDRALQNALKTHQVTSKAILTFMKFVSQLEK